MTPTSDHQHPGTIDPEQLLAECDVQRTRRSGPGGQHRNKVETAIVLTHRPTGIRAEASERRSQEENRRVALVRLRVKLAIEIRTTLRVTGAYTPSPLWRRRCRARRLTIARRHADYPALLAETLDVITAVDFDMLTAASALGTTSSQLVKLLRLEPLALGKINQARNERGLRSLS